MSPLFDLCSSLRKKDLTAFVDIWRGPAQHSLRKTGGLNLKPQADAEADKIVMSLPARVRAAAA